MREQGYVPAHAKSAVHESRNGILLCKTHRSGFDNYAFYIWWIKEVSPPEKSTLHTYYLLSPFINFYFRPTSLSLSTTLESPIMKPCMANCFISTLTRSDVHSLLPSYGMNATFVDFTLHVVIVKLPSIWVEISLASAPGMVVY